MRMEKNSLPPENIEIADAYLIFNDEIATAQSLDIPVEKVKQVLATSHAKRYVDKMFKESGYMNKHKIQGTLDSIIDKKLEELEEAEIGSSKDIADLMLMQHKMRIDEEKLAIEREKLELSKEHFLLKTGQVERLTKRKLDAAMERQHDKQEFEQLQNETQSTNYGALLERLLAPKLVGGDRVTESSERIERAKSA